MKHIIEATKFLKKNLKLFDIATDMEKQVYIAVIVTLPFAVALVTHDLHIKGEPKPRTYRKCTHWDYLALVKNRKPTAKKIWRAIGKQLGYLARNLGHIHQMLASGKALTPRQLEQLAVIRKVCEQQKYMYDNRCPSAQAALSA